MEAPATWGRPWGGRVSPLVIFAGEMDPHWETPPGTTTSLLTQGLVHRTAKAPVLGLSQARAPPAEAGGVGGEFLA